MVHVAYTFDLDVFAAIQREKMNIVLPVHLQKFCLLFRQYTCKLVRFLELTKSNYREITANYKKIVYPVYMYRVMHQSSSFAKDQAASQCQIWSFNFFSCEFAFLVIWRWGGERGSAYSLVKLTSCQANPPEENLRGMQDMSYLFFPCNGCMAGLISLKKFLLCVSGHMSLGGIQIQAGTICNP